MAKPAIVIGDGKFATKDTKFLAHAQGDSSSRFVARELTYDRGSNITATRVLPNGLIEKGRQNLLLQSNGLNNSPWAPSGDSTVTTGQSGYDGSSNAFLLSKVSEQYGGVNQDVTASNIHTFSAFLKAGSVNFVRLYVGSTSVFFDLSGSGSIGSTSGTKLDATITSFGNGWFRCTVTVSASTSVVKINPAIGDNDLGTTGDGDNGTGTGSIFVQDCQLEVGLVATAPITTGASTAKDGILEDQARVDYFSNSNGYLLLEPTRENLVIASEYIGGSAWTDVVSSSSTGVTALTNDAVSPEGVRNATKLVIDNTISSGAQWRLAANLSVTDEKLYTFSVFAKAAEFNQIQLDVTNDRFGDANVTATLTGDGSITAGGGTTASSIEKHGDGWYRIIMVATCASTGTTAVIFRLHAGGINGTGDGSKGVHVYGAQFEEGAFATSYIPTHGVAATRSAEGLPASSGSVIDMSGFMQGEDVTLVAELAENSSIVRDGSEASIRLSNGDSQAGSINIYRASASATTYRAVFFGTSDDSFDTDVNSAAVVISGSAPKIAISRDKGASSSTFTIYVNGSALANADGLTDGNGQFTNSYFQVTMDDLQITGEGSLLKLSKLKLFDSVLSTTEMGNETS